MPHPRFHDILCTQSAVLEQPDALRNCKKSVVWDGKWIEEKIGHLLSAVIDHALPKRQEKSNWPSRDGFQPAAKTLPTVAKHLKCTNRASLVAQWLRICLPMQGTRVRALVWEDPRSHVPRSSWAREPQLLSLRVWSLCSATREAAILRGPRTVMKSGPRLPQLERALAQKRRPNTAINK
ncbi:hypothetical protein J1605_004466 [Eschrichtius robustus]|uniref:Uncharacterized protein n=1 Tax=Eschrichtius robustus TaxID=9764 RepID=A0AB34HEK1_ESCRO|nr:hypothetical protein J1605_004466 [Eschrichtius robustus]